MPPSPSQKHSHHYVAADVVGCDGFSAAPPLLAVRSWDVEGRYEVAEWKAEDGEEGSE